MKILYIILLLIIIIYIINNYNYLENFNLQRNYNLVIVSAHYNEDLNWLKNSKYPVIICDKPTASPMDFEANDSCSIDINLGREASSFLMYIINNYNNLPDFIAFIHGHEHTFHQKHPYGILRAIETARLDKYEYISLNVLIQSIIYQEGLEFERNKPRIDYVSDIAHILMKDIWPIIYEPELGYSFPETLRYHRSAQFIVSRNKILAHPIEFYKKLYDFVIDPQSFLPNSNYNDFNSSCTLEFSWHMIFGLSPDFCETDPNDPIYNNCNEETYLHSRFIYP